MKNGTVLAIIFIFLIGIVGYVYLTTPSIDIDDFSVEKYMATTKYESGKIDKDYYIVYYFNVNNSKAIDYISGNVIMYDKDGSYLCEDSFYVYNDGAHTYDFTINVEKSVYKNIGSVELIILTSDGETVLYCMTTSDIKKGENINDYIDDVIDYTPKSTSTSSSSYSSNDYDSYDSENLYGDYIGNSNTHKFHQSFCSWADNIKSSNRVSFSSRQDAIDSGYSPCGHCNP